MVVTQSLCCISIQICEGYPAGKCWQRLAIFAVKILKPKQLVSAQIQLIVLPADLTYCIHPQAANIYFLSNRL